MLFDVHTHGIEAEHAVICADASRFFPQAGKCYSVGVHPWLTEGDTRAQWACVEAVATHPQVVAIGETGLDSLRGAPLAVQMLLFERHIALAEQVGKPLVVHMVRTSQQVLQVWRKRERGVACAIHGFRGNARVVKPLVDAGFYISFGEHFNAEALRQVPLCQLLAETDESALPISAIIARQAEALGMPGEQLQSVLAANLARFLHCD
ncbi:MAG: TatD family hydrolase [Sodaliphilus sp.]